MVDTLGGTMAVHRRGDSWVADFWLGGRGGRRVRRTAPTKTLAEAYEREAKAREFRGDVLEEQPEKITLSRLVELYELLHENANSPGTRKRNRIVWNNLERMLGDPMIQTITKRDMEEYRAGRLIAVTGDTVNLELRAIRSLFNRACEWGYLRSSPMRSIKLVRVDLREPRFLTPEEGHRLIEAASGAMRNFITVGLHTGLRRSELHSLKWEDIDLKRKELRVRKSKGRKFRVVPLNSVVSRALSEHPRHLRGPYVFCWEDGRQWSDVRVAFQAAVKRARLKGRISYHTMRHSFISNLVAAGVDLRSVQELAGHSSITVTMKYAHLRPERLREGVQALVR